MKRAESGAPDAHWSQGLDSGAVKFAEIDNKPKLADVYQEMLAQRPSIQHAALVRVNRRGPQPLYTEELAERILALMSEGLTITQICKMEGMPSAHTIMRWCDRPEFAQKYARARTLTADWHFNRVLEVAEDDTIEDVQRARLRVDAHKWYAEKLSPRQYGQQKQQLDVNMSVDMNVTTLDVRALSLEQRDQLKALLIAARDGSMKTIEHSPDDQAIESIEQSQVIEG